MHKCSAVLLASVLAACSPAGPTDETVESLVDNPQRLKELRRQCKLERAKLGDALCNRVSEATRQRFFGAGKTPTTDPYAEPEAP